MYSRHVIITNSLCPYYQCMVLQCRVRWSDLPKIVSMDTKLKCIGFKVPKTALFDPVGTILEKVSNFENPIFHLKKCLHKTKTEADISPPMFSVASARKFEIIVFPAWLGPTTATFTLYILKMSFSLVGRISGF